MNRAEASRAALMSAFNELVVTERYTDFGVSEIVHKADVSRSTFYEHFKSKDDLLRQSLSRVIAPLAATCDAHYDSPLLLFMVEHLRENRTLALGLINGPSSKQVIALFASLIEERLAVRSGRRKQVPLFLAAAQIAESQVGLLRAWLSRGGIEPATQIATALAEGTQALINQLI